MGSAGAGFMLMGSATRWWNPGLEVGERATEIPPMPRRIEIRVASEASMQEVLFDGTPINIEL
jgi:hypothetical protein